MAATASSVTTALHTAASAVAASVGPAVVRIGRHGGRGCGVVVADGNVLTNAHNLRDRTTEVTFADGRAAQGEVAAVDPTATWRCSASTPPARRPLDVGGRAADHGRRRVRRQPLGTTAGTRLTFGHGQRRRAGLPRSPRSADHAAASSTPRRWPAARQGSRDRR